VTHIVLLSGPGGRAFNHTNVEKVAAAMRAAGAEVTVLGDGETPVSREQVKETLEIIAVESKEPVTLFMIAHGDIKNGKHAIDIDGNWGLTSAELFESPSHMLLVKDPPIFL
jgi:nucleoside-triphosphatase THEP1